MKAAWYDGQGRAESDPIKPGSGGRRGQTIVRGSSIQARHCHRRVPAPGNVHPSQPSLWPARSGTPDKVSHRSAGQVVCKVPPESQLSCDLLPRPWRGRLASPRVGLSVRRSFERSPHLGSRTPFEGPGLAAENPLLRSPGETSGAGVRKRELTGPGPSGNDSIIPESGCLRKVPSHPTHRFPESHERAEPSSRRQPPGQRGWLLVPVFGVESFLVLLRVAATLAHTYSCCEYGLMQRGRLARPWFQLSGSIQ
jgi:hypothetical protein